MKVRVHNASEYRRGCRCEECTADHRRRIREQQSRRLTEDIPETVQHGTRATYVNYACRCEPCTAANTEAVRKYRAWIRSRDDR